MNVKALFDIFSLSAAALCSSMKTVIWPMSSTKKRLWQRMGTKRPNWKEFLEISHLRWGNGDTKPDTQSPLFSCWLRFLKNPFGVLQGIIKLDHPCIHVDFPVVICEAWRRVQDRLTRAAVWTPSRGCLSAGSLNYLLKYQQQYLNVMFSCGHA